MDGSWQGVRAAFGQAGQWFAGLTGLVGGRWDAPALGEWDVRALVGHASRSLVTVQEYLQRPAAQVDLASAADYVRAVRVIAAGPTVADRGVQAGAALGADPVAAFGQLAAQVPALLDTRDGTELISTIAGGMQLAPYLDTRIFELVVHGADLAAALGTPAQPPESAAARALAVVAELAAADGLAGPLLLAVTGRRGLPAGFTLL